MSIGKMKNGLYYTYFRYTDWQGVRKQKKKEGFKTKKEAAAFERAFLERFASVPTVSFTTLVQAYSEDCAARLKKSSIRNHQKTIRNHIMPFFQEYTIDAITPAIVRRWHTKLLKDGMSDSMLYIANTRLRAIFNFAMRYYGLSSNPSLLAGKIGKTKKSMTFWTISEFQKVMLYVSDPYYIVCFYTLFWTGMRMGELLALTWADIDLDSGFIRIEKTYSIEGKEEYIRTPKTPESIRNIQIPSFLIAMLKEYKSRLIETDGRIFFKDHSTVRRSFIKSTDHAGVKRIRLHDLRHSHASLLIDINIPILAISKRLGHKDANTTLQTYAHLYESKNEQTMEMIERAGL